MCWNNFFSWGKESKLLVMSYVSGYSDVLPHLQLWWLVSLWCSSCRHVTGPEFLLHEDTISKHISLPQISKRIWFGMLSLVIMNSHFVGRYQTLAYINCCIYVRLLGSCFPRTEEIGSQLFVVLVLDSWIYCSGEQPNFFHSAFASNGFIV